MKKQVMNFVMIGCLVGAASWGALAMADGHKGGSVQAAVDFRTSTMTIFKWYLKPMAGMVKGKMPFDQALFQRKADGLARAASLDLTEGFPKGSIGESEAKAEIWERWDDFKAKYEALQKESAKLQQVAASGDMAAIKAQFSATAKTCKGCHKEYRAKK